MVVAVAVAGSMLTGRYFHNAALATQNVAAAEQAVAVTVAVVEPRSTNLWDDFSGRLEAVEPRRTPPAGCGRHPIGQFHRG